MIKEFIIEYYKSIPIAFAVGFIIDLFIGDPMWLPHPVRWIGALISFLEKRLYPAHSPDSGKNCKSESAPSVLKGSALVLTVLVTTFICSSCFFILAYKISTVLLVIVMSVISWQCLAARSLAKAAMDVYKPLKSGDVEAARSAVSMIVGRDTAVLDEAGITRAAVETVAENTNDGVICPMFFLALGGPVAAIVYKAVSTMDSMIGYKNDKYIYFGRFAARLDDAFAFIPARISALLMIISTALMQCFGFIIGITSGAKTNYYSAANAIKIFFRDRNKHASPNSAQTESVCAGALGLRLAGPAVYFGQKLDKPYIGDDNRAIQPEDIRRSCVLMYISAFIFITLYLIIVTRS